MIIALAHARANISQNTKAKKEAPLLNQNVGEHMTCAKGTRE